MRGRNDRAPAGHGWCGRSENRSHSTEVPQLPIKEMVGLERSQPSSPSPPSPPGAAIMGKGNNSQKNDKKNLKPKQDKAKPATKK
jgi:hypothetical protein